jgi:hypothetical protein
VSFIQEIADEEATGALKELYDSYQETHGYIPNYVKALSLRPEVFQAWRELQGAIRKNLRLRQYELVTIAASSQMGCSY